MKDYRISEMLYDKCQNVITKPNKWICRCPLCGDSTTKKNARRFYINYYQPYDTYMYKCYRCGESNNLYMLYSILYDVSYKEAKIFLDDAKYDAKNIKNHLNNVHDIPKEEVNNTLDIDLKNDCYDVDDSPDSLLGRSLVKKLKAFIKKRKIDNNLFIAHSGRYKSRIIIPVINDNKLEYFQGRSLYNEILPKYLNPHVEKTNIIFNKNSISFDRDIIVTEGLIDAMSIGLQCTSTLGADISDEKLEQLFNLTKHTVIVCTDNDDAGKKSISRIFEKSKYHKILKYFIMPKKFSHIKDINELLLSGYPHDMENFIIENSHSYFYTKSFLKVK